MAPRGCLPAGHETVQERVRAPGPGDGSGGGFATCSVLGQLAGPFLRCGMGAARLTSWAVTRTPRDGVQRAQVRVNRVGASSLVTVVTVIFTVIPSVIIGDRSNASEGLGHSSAFGAQGRQSGSTSQPLPGCGGEAGARPGAGAGAPRGAAQLAGPRCHPL